MKKLFILFLIASIVVGALGVTPASAKIKNKYKPCVDYSTNTDNKYRLVVKASKNVGLYKERDRYNEYEVKDTSAKVQLQLVSTKTGKAVSAKKVNWVVFDANYKGVYTDTNGNTHDFTKYVTKKGKFNFPSVCKYLGNLYQSSWYNWGVQVYAVYKDKIYTAAFSFSDEVKTNARIADDPFNNIKAQVNDEWQLVPSGYVWGYERRDTLAEVVGIKVTDDIHCVYLAKGTEQTWVLKSVFTGEEKSIKGCPTQLEYMGRKDPKVMQVTKTGTKVTDVANSIYIYSVYYDGKVYSIDVHIVSSEDEVFEKEWYWDLNAVDRVITRIQIFILDDMGIKLSDAQRLALRVKALKAYIGDDFGKNFERDYAVTYEGLSESDYKAKIGMSFIPSRIKHDFHKGYRDVMISIMESEYNVNTSGWDWSDY